MHQVNWAFEYLSLVLPCTKIFQYFVARKWAEIPFCGFTPTCCDSFCLRAKSPLSVTRIADRTTVILHSPDMIRSIPVFHEMLALISQPGFVINLNIAGELLGLDSIWKIWKDTKNTPNTILVMKLSDSHSFLFSAIGTVFILCAIEDLEITLWMKALEARIFPFAPVVHSYKSISPTFGRRPAIFTPLMWRNTSWLPSLGLINAKPLSSSHLINSPFLN